MPNTEPKKLPQAVIFDLDGIITDTAEYHYQAWKKVADDLGILFNRQINERLKGVSRLESLDIILEQSSRHYSQAEKQAIATRKNELYNELIHGITPNDLLPGIKPLFEELRCSGIKAALASASKNARTVVDRLQIEGWFNCIVDGADFKKGKPDPELFLTAAQRLGASPPNCVGIEDAASGIQALKAAGMCAVGVGDPKLLKEADWVVDSTAAITLAGLMAAFHKVSCH